MSLLQVKDLTLRFGGLTAVDKVSFEVPAGQIFAVIGPNGAGKTSVFNAITGVYTPTSGQVLVRGRKLIRRFSMLNWVMLLLGAALTGVGVVLAVNLESLWEAVISANYIYQQPFPWGEAFQDGIAYMRETEARYTLFPGFMGAFIGLCSVWAVWQRARRNPEVAACACLARTFQNSRLFHQLTVIENVLVGMDTKLTTRAWHAALRLPRHRKETRSSCKKAMEILRFVGLDDEAQDMAGSLSYGHQRRLEIARALAIEPVLLLLDEPAAGMNPTEAVELTALVRKIRDTGIAVLLIEHHMKVVMGISDRIAVLQYGSKIAEGTPAEILANPQVRAAYLGGEEAV